MDCIPDADVLERGILDLVAKELADHNLSVGVRKGRHVLVTNRALKEGATICPGSALLFSTPVHVREFLNTSFHAALSDSPLLTIEGLDTVMKKRSMSVQAVLVGAGRLLTDFRGFRKWSNCAFRVNPAAGANDHFLTLIVQTHNGCGVAAGSEIMADLGEGFVPGSGNVGDRPLSKKFKGALDAMFEKQRSDIDNGLDAAQAKADGLDAAQAKANGQDGQSAGSAAAGARVAAPSTAAASTATASTAGSSGAGNAVVASTEGSAAVASAAGNSGAGSAAAVSMSGSSGSGAAGGQEVLGKYNLVQAVFENGQVKLQNSTKNGIKIPPQSTLLTIDQGRLTNPTNGKSDVEIPFTPTPKASVILKTGSQISAISTFADIIKKEGCSALYQHHGFAKGAAPAAFAVKKPTVMAPAREDVAKALMGATTKGKPSWQWTWIVEIQKEKIMPIAVALTNKKQVIVKLNSTEPL